LSYRIGDRLTLEALAGAGFGLGISTVSVNGFFLRGMLGISHAF
jgi:hypothetical protein